MDSGIVGNEVEADQRMRRDLLEIPEVISQEALGNPSRGQASDWSGLEDSTVSMSETVSDGTENCEDGTVCSTV